MNNPSLDRGNIRLLKSALTDVIIFNFSVVDSCWEIESSNNWESVGVLDLTNEEQVHGSQATWLTNQRAVQPSVFF